MFAGSWGTLLWAGEILGTLLWGGGDFGYSTLGGGGDFPLPPLSEQNSTAKP